MEYIELKKIYYSSSESDYVEEYYKRFNSKDTIKIDFFIGDKQAFFIETTDVLKQIIKIIELNEQVNKISDQLPGVAIIQYSKKCMIDEIVITNKIEGVHSSRKEIDEVLDTLQKQLAEKGKFSRYSGLVSKYLKLMNNDNIPLNTCQDIRNIYNEIFLDEILFDNPSNQPDGEIFRKGAESVYNEAGKEIHKGIYPEKKIIDFMNLALNFLNDDEIMPIYRISIFHYLLEYIHPFYDGNGRLGRFILSYCISKKFNSLLAYHISQTIKENIKEYYKAFESCNDSHNLGDLTPFLIMQLKMIYSAISELKESLNEKIISFNKYTDTIEKYFNVNFTISNNTNNLYYILLQASLFSENGVTNKELQLLLKIKTNSTVKKLLDKVPYDLLLITNKGKTKYYQLNLSNLDDIMIGTALKNNNF